MYIYVCVCVYIYIYLSIYLSIYNISLIYVFKYYIRNAFIGRLVFPKPMGGKEAHEIHDRPALQKGEQEGESERRTDEALRYYRNPSEEVPPDDLPAYLSVCVCSV